MPLYTVMTQDGLLSAKQRHAIATELVRIHTTAMGVPGDFVHSIFPTYPRDHAYVAANRSPVASVLDSCSYSRRSYLRGQRHGSFSPSGKCFRTKQEYPIAISPSRSRKCLPARPWKMG
jgi:hypothetical protein